MHLAEVSIVSARIWRHRYAIIDMSLDDFIINGLVNVNINIPLPKVAMPHTIISCLQLLTNALSFTRNETRAGESSESLEQLKYIFTRNNTHSHVSFRQCFLSLRALDVTAGASCYVCGRGMEHPGVNYFSVADHGRRWDFLGLFPRHLGVCTFGLGDP